MIGAQAIAAKAYLLNQLPVEVSHTPWYADAKGEAWQALEMKGTPVIIGIRKGRMEWDDQRPAEGFRHLDLRSPDLGGVSSPPTRAESPRPQVPCPTDRATPISQARLAGLTEPPMSHPGLRGRVARMEWERLLGETGKAT